MGDAVRRARRVLPARARCTWPRSPCSSPPVSASTSARSTGSASLIVAALLAYEHSLVRPGDLRRLDAAFFTMNGVI